MVGTGASATLTQFSRGRGILRVTTTGTIIPQFTFSAAPGAVGLIKAGTYYRVKKLGDASFTNSPEWA
jgi:hypothetical protein